MATEPKGIDVSSWPTFSPARSTESAVPTADRVDEGEMP
jgi:hypothetical protein